LGFPKIGNRWKRIILLGKPQHVVVVAFSEGLGIPFWNILGIVVQ